MRDLVHIGDREVGSGRPCFIIAEAGSNHDGDLDRAYQLIDMAADAGADAVKFQVFSAERIAADTRDPIASLEGDEFGQFGASLTELYRKLELPREWLPLLAARCAERGIMFSATPFDEDAADEIDATGVSFHKLASFELVHTPLLRHVARLGKPVILSTGLATLDEVGEALAVLEQAGCEEVVLLHCGIQYPLDPANVNLRAMVTLMREFGVPAGYSDHTMGTTVAAAAVALGGCVIEKHFTTSRDLHGPDHAFALEPAELSEMVTRIRETEAALGSEFKAPTEAEMLHRARGRRSIFAARDLEAGRVLELADLVVLRPASGLEPKHIDTVVGRRLARSLVRHDPLTWDSLEE